MDKLTLEQAAVLHSKKAIDSHRESTRSFTESLNISFQAGAVWQKKQYKLLIELIREGMPVLLTEGFDDLVEQIDNELKQLQD